MNARRRRERRDIVTAMIERLLALDLEQLQPTRQERVRQLVARLQAAKRSRDAAATQLEEDLEDPATRAELMLQEAQERLREGRYGNSEARQLADEMDALAAADPGAERAEELRALAARLRGSPALDKFFDDEPAAAGGGEGPLLGPLEGTIKALKKETASLGEESLQHQRDWLNDQTQLVNVTAETEDLLEKNSEFRAKVSILNEKKLRTVKGAATQDADIKRLAKEMDMMHTDMSRLNDLIGKNTELSAELQNSNSVMEMDFVSELKELEEKSVAMETKLTAVKSTKAELLDEIMEAERQLLLWEKKIQLEKETQAALDPEVGQSEARSMEKEIHRMRLRFDTLKRDQERMIKEMERCVMKREAIALRARGKTDAGLTQAALRKQLLQKKQELKKLSGEGRAIDSDIDVIARDMEKVSRCC